MSIDLATAMDKTERIIKHLAPGCHTISVAGSVRRRRAEVKDFEIVAVPIHLQTSLFGEVDWEAPTKLDAIIGELIARKALRWDTDQKRNGPLWKRLVVCSVGISLDLFLTAPETFGNILMIRTGDADFSHQVVTSVSFGGLMPRGYSHQNAKLYCGSTFIPCPTEADLFNALGIPTDAIPAPEVRTKDSIGQLREVQLVGSHKEGE